MQITASPTSVKKEKKKKKKQHLEEQPETNNQTNGVEDQSQFEKKPKKSKKRKLEESDAQPTNNNVEKDTIKKKKKSEKKNKEMENGDTVAHKSENTTKTVENIGENDTPAKKPSLLKPAYLTEPTPEPPMFHEGRGGRGGNRGRERFGGRGRDRGGRGRDRFEGKGGRFGGKGGKFGGRGGRFGMRDFGDKNSPNLMPLDKNNVELIEAKSNSPEKETGSDGEGTPVKKPSLLNPDYLTAPPTSPPPRMFDSGNTGSRDWRGGKRGRFGGGGGRFRGGGGRFRGGGGRGRGGGRHGGRGGGFKGKRGSAIPSGSANNIPVIWKKD